MKRLNSDVAKYTFFNIDHIIIINMNTHKKFFYVTGLELGSVN